MKYEMNNEIMNNRTMHPWEEIIEGKEQNTLITQF